MQTRVQIHFNIGAPIRHFTVSHPSKLHFVISPSDDRSISFWGDLRQQQVATLPLLLNALIGKLEITTEAVHSIRPSKLMSKFRNQHQNQYFRSEIDIKYNSLDGTKIVNSTSQIWR
ncbi:MAG: hypothetical protein EZS28_003791 [Streblomastix strix]|uniref:Uncharacterized protein n=1 Tax=Streblomastix strix TaxID=222440 RepID=A0A5J4X0M5_9EUKA|nr:MAG: hypothetical protein EZS28_003791 [Streblomastix strix]